MKTDLNFTRFVAEILNSLKNIVANTLVLLGTSYIIVSRLTGFVTSASVKVMSS